MIILRYVKKLFPSTLVEIKESNYNESPYLLNTSFDTKCLIFTSASDFHLPSV